MYESAIIRNDISIKKLSFFSIITPIHKQFLEENEVTSLF